MPQITLHQILVSHKQTKTRTYLASTENDSPIIFKKIIDVPLEKNTRKFEYVTAANVEREIIANHDLNLLRGFSYTTDESKKTRTYQLIIKQIPGQCLAEYIESNTRFSSQQWLNLLFFMAKGLERVHKKGYAHRDVRAENFIINPERIVAIDFGYSIKEKDAAANLVYGNTYYVAPETDRENAINDQRSDLTSLGVSFGYLLGYVTFGRCLRKNPDFTEQQPKALVSKGFNFDEITKIKEIIQGLLDDDPDKRPSLERVINELRKLIKQEPSLLWIDKKEYTALTKGENIKNKVIEFNTMKLSELTLHGYEEEAVSDHKDSLLRVGNNPESYNSVDLSQFYFYLDELRKKRYQFQCKKVIDPKYYPAHAALNILIGELEKEAISLDRSNKDNNSYQSFQRHCKQAIEKAKPELEKHRGLKPLIKNIALAIVGLGVFYLIAYACNGGQAFFKSTDSAKKLKRLDRTIDELSRPN